EHRHAVRTDDDEVLEVTVLELDASADDVVPAGDALVGGAEPDDDTRSGLHVSVAAVAVVAGRAARRLVAHLHRLLRAVAAVGPTLGEEALGRLAVEIESVGLVV